MKIELYSQWLQTCLIHGIPAISTDTSARIMAVLYEYGNNEGFTFNQKFLADKDYIQERFHLQGGETPDAYFTELLNKYIKEIQDYQEVHKDDGNDNAIFKLIAPDWCPKLLRDRYDIDFIG